MAISIDILFIEFASTFGNRLSKISEKIVSKKNIEESMSTLKNLNSKLTFSEYLDYLSDNIDFSDENYNYMIIVERMENSDINDCYYYALKLKY